LTLDFPSTGVRLAILFVCQPETATSTRVYKLVAHNGYGGSAQRIAEQHTAADRLSVAYRALLADLAAATGS
jgi:hypothetical protein